ncbi:hypothetical protein ACFQ0X_28620 [Streptomyces rectiviolaceus]|uniref:hypothetical protein n=1 Tax=Streptomyces rectiviolaceus TaxID=332591 RepID=UPI003626542A
MLPAGPLALALSPVQPRPPPLALQPRPVVKLALLPFPLGTAFPLVPVALTAVPLVRIVLVQQNGT